MPSPVVVWSAALLAALLRFPGAMWPIRADEAGYLLVARHWDPQPDSMYGSYWLDRPPILIAFVKLADAVGGPLFPRIVAAAGCAVLVVAAAACARIVAGDRAAAWTAVATMAVTGNTMIDTVAAKGEILAVPLIVVSFWLALRALDRDRMDRRAVALAAGSGLAATLALGFKQNMAAGLVFGAVLLVGSLVTERIDRAEFARLAAAALAGAAVPVVGTVAWALGAGVRLESVWDAVYGFRGDALMVIAAEVIADGAESAPAERALVLVAIVLATGIAFVIGGVIVHVREVSGVDPVLTAAATVVLTVDGIGLVMGGSFWRAYLFALVPGTVLCLALLLAVRGRVAHRARTVAMAALVCSLVSSVAWVVGHNVLGVVSPTEVYTGHAVASAARPGDTIVV